MVLTTSSQLALYSTVFLACTSFSAVMPTLWPYLQSLGGTPGFLALVVAIYSLGEGAGALLFGTFRFGANTRQAMIISMVIGVIGSILYITPSRYAVLIGRLMHGIWTGAEQAVQQAYLSEVVPSCDLTQTVVTLNAFASLGFVFGPAFGFLSSLLPPVSFVGGAVTLSQLTAPGFFVLVSSVVCVVIYIFIFNEQEDRADGNYSRDIISPLDESSDKHYETSKEKDEELLPLLQNKSSKSPIQNRIFALVFCNIAFFIHFYGFAIQETVTTPFVQNLFNWTVRDANALFTVGGVLSLFAFAVLQTVARRVSDQTVLLSSFALGALGWGLLVFSEHHFIFGFALLSLSFPVGRASCVSLYTKILPKSAQHFGQGVILAVGAAARIVGPFPAAIATSGTSLSMLLVFGSAAIAFAFCGIIQVSTIDHLKTT